MTDDIDALRSAFAELSAEREALVQAHKEEVARLKHEARETVVLGALRTEATRLGAYDPDAVIALMDRSSLNWSDQGQLLGVEDAMMQARQDRKFLFREENDLTAMPNPRGSGSVPKPASIQERNARSLSDQEYAVRKRQFLAGVI